MERLFTNITNAGATVAQNENIMHTGCYAGERENFMRENLFMTETTMAPVKIALDHGWSSIKGEHIFMETSVVPVDYTPLTNHGLLEYKGQKYIVGQGRLGKQATKTENENYFLLTLAGIAKELQYQGKTQTEHVELYAGVPLTLFGAERKEFRDYLWHKERISFTFEGVHYSIFIDKVMEEFMRNTDNKKDNKVLMSLRISAEDKEQIEEKARKTGLTTSEYIRRCALGRKLPCYGDTSLLKEYSMQLGKIGSNLNQIAKHLNSGVSYYSVYSDVKEAVKELLDLKFKILPALEDVACGRKHRRRECEGTGFNKILKKYKIKGVSIFDVWKMTLEEAVDFFEDTDKSISKTCSTASEIMLGHLHIGQPTGTLSGGENIRIKIMKASRSTARVIGVDEPFKGLSNIEIDAVAMLLNKIREKGRTLIVIDHTAGVEDYFSQWIQIENINDILCGRIMK